MIAPDILEQQTTIEWLSISEIDVDMTYQRPISRDKVRAISKRFNKDSVGSLMVNVRDTGKIVVMDGQHRKEAMKEVGLLLAECKVYHGLTIQQEARIYIDCNLHRKMPEALDMFRARAIEREPVVMAIMSVVEQCGLTIQFFPTKKSNNGGTRKRAPKVIWAVACLENIYRRGKEELLKEVLMLALECWPDDGTAFDHKVLLGICHFHQKYKDHYRREELIARMNVIALNTLRRRADYHSESGGGSAYPSFSKALQEAYDKGRRTRRLENIK